ncbi:MAG: alanine racemase [Solibacillus sp.]
MLDNFEQIFTEIERPFAWLDLDALEQNIAFVNEACGQKKIRIATKSIRSAPMLNYISKRIHHFAGFMTFTASETLFLLEQDLDEFLIGYPVYEKQSITRLAEWVKSGKSITFMVDAMEQAALLNTIAQSEGILFEICIDVNVSTDFQVLYFGSKRSPIANFQALKELTDQLQAYESLIVSGVMGYDAQIAGVADQSSQLLGLQTTLIRTLKKQAKKKVTAFRQFAVAHVKSLYDVKFVNAGGSGSMQFTAQQQEVTEITVGSAFFAPALFDRYDSLTLAPAAGFALRVTRQFAPNIVVCHGGGYIASGAVGKDRLPTFMEADCFEFLPLEGAGEVQTPVVVKKGTVSIGDTLYLRHAKAGELCERFQVLHAVKDGRYFGQIQTYRGDGQCFL